MQATGHLCLLRGSKGLSQHGVVLPCPQCQVILWLCKIAHHLPSLRLQRHLKNQVGKGLDAWVEEVFLVHINCLESCRWVEFGRIATQEMCAHAGLVSRPQPPAEALKIERPRAPGSRTAATSATIKGVLFLLPGSLLASKYPISAWYRSQTMQNFKMLSTGARLSEFELHIILVLITAVLPL